MVFPITAGSAPKLRRHRRSLRTTTGRRVRSSPGRRVRPRMGLGETCENCLGTTLRPTTKSGTPLPVSVNGVSRPASRDSARCGLALHKSVDGATLRDAIRAEAASATRFGAEKSAECVVRAGKRRCKYAAPLKANPASNVRIADAETRRRRFSLLTTVSRLLSASYTQNPRTPKSLRTTWQSKYQLYFDVSYCIARGYLCYSRETNADLTDSGILDVQNRTVPRIGRRDWEMRDRGLT